MFNRELEAPTGYGNNRAIGGLYPQDYETFRTLYAGQDPADPARALVRKLVKVGSTYCYEETRITPQQDKKDPSVHIQLFRVKDFDLKESLTPQELQLRGLFRPVPNVMGYSIYYRDGTAKTRSATLVENTLTKNGGTWLEWFQDLRDRRDMSAYLRIRWNAYI